MVERRLRRCAIYTRKSSEDGLEQDFNSLDAQFEACTAYIRSQAGEGWKPVSTRYDDGGYSGGSMDRPALSRLLADIRDRRIDTVVVYKVDRLTRSLADFARIVDVFDAHGVTFVSVTQQFNTTTSMGRLTLNMLLSFAQFEREVTGERIRDKIAASKQKGMWMGGFVPLGYESCGRTLKIKEPEAEIVRTLFRLYLEHGTVRRTKAAADAMGLASPTRVSSVGRPYGGGAFSRGYIYKLLGNPIYIGRIAHKDETYEGQHPALVDRETWDAVQATLAGNTQAGQPQKRATEPSPLARKLVDAEGRPLTPTHAVKGGRRYRYYVSRHLIAGGAGADGEDDRNGWRLPAGEIERTVARAVGVLLADPAALAAGARSAGIEASLIPALLADASRWGDDSLSMATRVELHPDRIELELDMGPLGAPEATIRHTVDIVLRRRGVETRLVLAERFVGRKATPPDATLVKAILRAHRWLDDLASGRRESIAAIAEAEGCSKRYVAPVLRLAFLAPEIVEAILAGTQPVDLTAEVLIKRTELPFCWEEQKALLGFR